MNMNIAYLRFKTFSSRRHFEYLWRHAIAQLLRTKNVDSK